MILNNYLKWLLLAFLSVFLIACKPTAQFNYQPSTPKVGQVIQFDASSSSVYKASEGNAIASYVWDFGNGEKATGKVVNYTYKQAGEYKVSLTVTDLADQVHSTTQKIKVIAAEDTVKKTVEALVLSSNGVPLKDAKVTLHGQHVQTNAEGYVRFDVILPKNTQRVVAQFEKKGFINQAIVYDVENLNAISAQLLVVKQTLQVNDIAQAQIIQAADLNAQIRLPAEAFVNADGSVARGLVYVEFTPWDIDSEDLNAMPANGVARNAQGQTVDLISLGMISARFTDVNGQALQLAPGKQAVIRMDLPAFSINEQEIYAGMQIPMWHFNESEGLWVEEGVGQVIHSQESWSGFAVEATVSHFSTWNWDLEFNNPNRIFVQCQDAGVPVACHVTAEILLSDFSQVTKSQYIPVNGLEIINLPENGEIFWSAKNTNGTKLAQASSATTGQVILQLQTPKTKNFVRCEKDQQPVACTATVNGYNFDLPVEGGYVSTLLDEQQLNWTAVTEKYESETSVYRLTGEAQSNTSDAVVIQLDQHQKLFDKTAYTLRCENDDAVGSCLVAVWGDYYNPANGQWDGFRKELSLNVNQMTLVYLPIPAQETLQSFWINGRSTISKNGLEKHVDLYHYQDQPGYTLIFDFKDAEWCDPSKGWEDVEWIDDQLVSTGYPPCWSSLPQ